MVTDTLTDSQTEMQHNDPAQYTGLGWVKNKVWDVKRQHIKFQQDPTIHVYVAAIKVFLLQCK